MCEARSLAEYSRVYTNPPAAPAMEGIRLASSRTPEPIAVRGAETRVALVRAAMRDGRLRLRAQPIVDLRTGATMAEELLLRIKQPNGRLDLPGPYIHAAERYSLATEIDAWVLNEAARLAASGRNLHLNLSGQTLADSHFADEIEAALERHGTDPRHLTFEITETAPAAVDTGRCVVVDRIARLGAGLALDDFGTGYGSFDYLRRLPVTMLKIDREFVAEIETDERCLAVVDSIVLVAERLKLSLVAEGVETEDAAALLRERGVSLAQGFHLGLPARPRRF